jgi:hypothetical protein
MPIPHPIPWIFLLLVVGIAQGGILWLLIRRLERLHPALWNQLGQPKIGPRWLTFRAEWDQMLAQHRLLLITGLPDRKAMLLVWCARIGYGVVAVLFLLSVAEGPISCGSCTSARRAI